MAWGGFRCQGKEGSKMWQRNGRKETECCIHVRLVEFPINNESGQRNVKSGAKRTPVAVILKSYSTPFLPTKPRNEQSHRLLEDRW